MPEETLGVDSHRPRSRLTATFAAALAFLLPVALCGGFAVLPAGSPAILRIGLVPEINIFQQKARFRPLGEHLSIGIGCEVRMILFGSYRETLERLSDGSLDGAFLGSFSSVIAIDRLGAVPLARPEYSGGQSSFHALVLVRRDGPVQQLEDLRGRRIALVSRETTAGYLFPLALLRRSGVTEPSSFFSEILFAGSHDAAIATLLAGRTDAAAARETMFERARRADPSVDRDLRILATSDALPESTLVVRGKLAPELRERLSMLLLSAGRDDTGRAALAALEATRFVPTGSEAFDPIRLLAREAGVAIALPPPPR